MEYEKKVSTNEYAVKKHIANTHKNQNKRFCPYSQEIRTNINRHLEFVKKKEDEKIIFLNMNLSMI